jgi:hypothetical protein
MARRPPTCSPAGHESEMFLNLETAKALGITLPLPLLGRGDEVIE